MAVDGVRWLLVYAGSIEFRLTHLEGKKAFSSMSTLTKMRELMPLSCKKGTQ